MATPTIPNGEEYFFPILYEGNGAGQRVGKFVPFTDNGTIANSCIFNSADSAYLTRTPSSSGSGTTFTVSFWFKIGKLGHSGDLFSNSPSGSAANIFYITHYSDNTILVHGFNSGGSFSLNLQTTRTFEDTSKWYHLLCAVDTTQSTSTDRVKLYIDGSQITAFSSAVYPGSSDNFGTNQSGVPQLFGRYNFDATRYHDGYIAEANMVDGTALTPSTFGVVDTSTGRWIPKTLSGITYGTNGFRLTFADSSALGDDTSGNTNDFSVTNIVAGDQTTDSPTQNFNTMGSFSSGVTKAEGNLKITTPSSGSGYEQCVGQPAFGVRSGKWYWEVKVNVKGQNGYGWKSDDNTGGSQANATGNYKQGPVYVVGGVGGFADGTWDVNFSTGASEFSAFTTASVDDVIMFAIDLDNRKGYVGLNGTWFNSANPANGTGSIGLGRDPVPSANARFYPMCLRLNTTATGTYNFGATSFAHTPPTGFVALGQDNLPETDKGISGLVWIKDRDAVRNHNLFDSSRGKHKELRSNSGDEELTNADTLQKFLKGGCSVEDGTSVNNSGNSYVNWNWVANGGTTASNTDGSITSTVQANTTAGFSIVEYTGSGSAATVGHGLSSTPEWFIIKSSSLATNWYVYHKSMGETYQMYLNLSNAQDTSVLTAWNDTAPTSSVISLAPTGYGSNNASATYLIYAWHGVEGFSKFGKYVGNASTDGPFIYTGFKPAWVMVKNASGSSAWVIYDNKRNSFNPMDKYLLADSTAAEATAGSLDIDMVSNGFKIRGNDGGYNGSGITVIYMAFASNPFVGDGTSPVTAR